MPNNPRVEDARLSVRLRSRVRAQASRQVQGESLAVFRIAFGAVGLLSALRLFANGWVASLYVDPVEHLRYPATSWVPVPPGWALYALVGVIALSAVGVMVGYRYRAAVVTFWVAFTWLEMLEATVYLNHYWFITLAGAVMVMLPMAAAWSIDSRRHGPRSVPLIAIWALRFQLGVVYVFAGVAKLHGDWLLHGLPLGLWLPARSDAPLIGPLLDTPLVALAGSWAGAAFDCTVVGFLLWRRTRLFAWIVAVGFHVATWLLFPVIGVFPWLMIGASTVFFDPDWPSRAWRRVTGSARRPLSQRPSRRAPVAEQLGSGDAAAVLGCRSARGRRVVLVAAGLWVVLQLVLPLRHLLYPGDHRWSNEGFRFGWNVMLVEKAGEVTFLITDTATGRTWRDDGAALYTEQQRRVMGTDPELIRQAAHAVAAEASTRPEGRVEVRVDAVVSLNGRPAAALIDPTVDLAGEPWRAGPQPWILPAPTTDPPGAFD